MHNTDVADVCVHDVCCDQQAQSCTSSSQCLTCFNTLAAGPYYYLEDQATFLRNRCSTAANKAQLTTAYSTCNTGSNWLNGWSTCIAASLNGCPTATPAPTPRTPAPTTTAPATAPPAAASFVQLSGVLSLTTDCTTKLNAGLQKAVHSWLSERH
jgi:hypothetical protein